MMTTSKPAPSITRDSEDFWQFANDGKLMLRSCNDCGELMYYPRIICKKCLSQNLDWTEASGHGAIHAFTIVHRAPSDAFREDVPYVIAIIELDEGPRLMTNVIGSAPESIEIGQRVELTFETRGNVVLPQFHLASTNEKDS